MKAGRELDVLVAQHRLGEINLIVATEIMGFDIGYTQCPDYTGNIADAWQVVEHLTTGGEWNYKFGIQILSDGWWANFMVGLELSHHAPTAPLAICLAALKAVGVTPTQEETP